MEISVNPEIPDKIPDKIVVLSILEQTSPEVQKLLLLKLQEKYNEVI